MLVLFLLIPHYNSPASTSSDYKPSLDTIPLEYYDYPGAYGGNGVNGGASTARVPLRTRENATFVVLASNSDIDDAVRSVHELEIRFNHKYKYSWVFLNDQPFSDNFKKCVLTPFLFSLIMCPDVVGARTHKSRVHHCVGTRPFWADSRRALASAFVDRRGQGDGGEREVGKEWRRKR